ncbi:MAG: hypothetical protein IJV31_00965 [Clostridia bacterium]|nr:hypothetical protein [Clostridia bacterium]MBQ9657321.1 hypothetical protein [Clostridia bacterium]
MVDINRNFYKRINAIAAEGQFDIEPMRLTSGYCCVLMRARSVDEYSKMLAVLRRKRNIVIADFNHNTYSVRCFYPDDYAKNQEFYEKQRNLIDVFWTAKHNEKSAEESKQLVYKYAVEHDAVNVYNSIYHTA